MKNIDIFKSTEHKKPPRAKPRIMAHVEDAGCDYIYFRCPKCGWGSGWIQNNMTLSASKKGIPCKVCN